MQLLLLLSEGRRIGADVGFYAGSATVGGLGLGTLALPGGGTVGGCCLGFAAGAAHWQAVSALRAAACWRSRGELYSVAETPGGRAPAAGEAESH